VESRFNPWLNQPVEVAPNGSLLLAFLFLAAAGAGWLFDVLAIQATHYYGENRREPACQEVGTGLKARHEVEHTHSPLAQE
jgi:hypothetical protein